MKRTFPAKVIEEEQRVIMTTAAAQAPAPGKLEFKDDYTPDEAERVIRNSKGLPVGVRPKMVWTWKKALLWAAIAIVCACGWAILAVSRGERISAIWFLVVALSSYAIAYRFYAYYIQIKIMRTDDANATPAERVHDGANFERTDRRVLFGQHFAGISGAGPRVGPILAAQMGYLPSTLWIILGVIFAGAVQDMLVLWISAKRRGRSLGQMATDEMGKFGGMILSIFLVVMTAIAMAFLALVAIKAMAASPWAVFSIGMTIPIALIMGCYQRFLRPGRVIETTLLGFVLLVLDIVAGGWIASIPAVAAVFTLDAKQLVIALVIYSFAAAALPHWLLVTPRDYLSTLMKIGTLVLLVIGIIIANPSVKVPGLTELASTSTGPTFSGNLFPFLFITIACGALSGFHGAVSSGLTPKAVEKENQIRMIGYGSMLVESFTAVIALIAAITISQGVYFSTNMSAAQITAASGVSISATSTPGEQADAAVKAVESMKVSDIEGNQMQVTWDSVDENGAAKTYEGAAALEQAAADIGETSIVSRTGGATTFAMGMANFLKSYLGLLVPLRHHVRSPVHPDHRGQRHPRGPLPDRRNARQRAQAQEVRRPDLEARQHHHHADRHRAVGRTAVDGRVRRERRHQRDGAYLRHLQPAARRRLLRADHRVCGQDGLLEAPVDTGGTARVGHRRDLHRRLPEDLRAAELLHHRLQVSGADRLRRADRRGADQRQGRAVQRVSGRRALRVLPGHDGRLRGSRHRGRGAHVRRWQVRCRNDVRGAVRGIPVVRALQPGRHRA